MLVSTHSARYQKAGVADGSVSSSLVAVDGAFYVGRGRGRLFNDKGGLGTTRISRHLRGTPSDVSV